MYCSYFFAPSRTFRLVSLKRKRAWWGGEEGRGRSQPLWSYRAPTCSYWDVDEGMGKTARTIKSGGGGEELKWMERQGTPGFFFCGGRAAKRGQCVAIFSPPTRLSRLSIGQNP
jgi:hypothetical protein